MPPSFYPTNPDDFTLIKVIPKKDEISLLADLSNLDFNSINWYCQISCVNWVSFLRVLR
ncbi:MAG: hypothetical protein FD133_1669, partial [Erysipelotrichaceae bacterium]